MYLKDIKLRTTAFPIPMRNREDSLGNKVSAPLKFSFSPQSDSDGFVYSEIHLDIKGVDLVGFFAFVYAIITASLVSTIGMFFASKVLNEKFSTTFSSLGYAYAPLFIITGLGHLFHSFFTKTYANIGNGFIQGFSLDVYKIENLASRNDSWLHIFDAFPYIAMLLGFYILYKRVNLFTVSKIKKFFAFLFSSSLILFFLWFSLFRVYVAAEYGMKKRINHSSINHKKMGHAKMSHNKGN
jgi:hypothetical protein